MSGKSYTIMVALVILLSTGCTRQLYHDGGSPIDKNWGRSYEEQKYSQIIDHEAGKNHRTCGWHGWQSGCQHG